MGMIGLAHDESLGTFFCPWTFNHDLSNPVFMNDTIDQFIPRLISDGIALGDFDACTVYNGTQLVDSHPTHFLEG